MAATLPYHFALAVWAFVRMLSLCKADSMGPTLCEFSYDLSYNLLTLTFNEIVRSDSVQVDSFTLQSRSNAWEFGASRFQLTNSSMVTTTNNSNIITIQLGAYDVDFVTTTSNFVDAKANTFLSFRETAVTDLVGNKVVPITDTNAIQVDAVTPDYKPPQLLQFELDMDAGHLSLTFSEITVIFYPRLVSITNSEFITEVYNLTGGKPQVKGRTVSVKMSEFDLNRIKANSRLASAISDSFLRTSVGFVLDIALNKAAAISALQAAWFVSDVTRPVLESFQLSMSNGRPPLTLDLIFSETVNASTVFPVDLTLQSDANFTRFSRKYTLTGASSILNSYEMISIVITPVDLAAIRDLSPLATNTNNTFLSFSSTAVTDMNRNIMLAIPQTNATKARNVTSDLVKPTLDEFCLNLINETLQLTFSEAVNVTTAILSNISIYKSTNSTRFVLTGRSLCTNPSKVVMVTLAGTEFAILKQGVSLATNITNIFVTVEAGAVQDIAGNDVEGKSHLPASELACDDLNKTGNDACPIMCESDYAGENCETRIDNCVSSPCQNGGTCLDGVLNYQCACAEGYTGTHCESDLIRPSLHNFSYDLSYNILTLTFDEVVRLDSVRISSFTLQSRSNGSQFNTSTFQLTNSSMATTTNNSNIITIQLGAYDIDFVTTTSNFVDAKANTFLSFRDTAVTDLVGNKVVPITDTIAKQVDVFITDYKPPQLLQFELDMDAGHLSLTFSEITVIFYPRLVSIIDSASSTEVYNLTDGEIHGGRTVSLYLSEFDLNKIKANRRLAVTHSTSFLSASSGFALDIAGNKAAAISALRAASFVSDATRPVLESFQLSMSNGRPPLTLCLFFNETVDVRTLFPVNLTLQSDANFTRVTRKYTLTGADSILDSYEMISFNITSVDLAAIRKLSPLGTNPSNTFLSFPSTTMTDMSGNSVLSIPETNASKASAVAADLVKPKLNEFSLNLINETLKLTFSEAVNVATAILSKISIHKSTNSTRLVLTGGSLFTNPNNVLIVTLALVDLTILKQGVSLATNISSIFVTMEAGAVQDIAGNDVEGKANLQASGLVSYDSNGIDDCVSSPCQNGGNCLDRVLSYQCDCPKGYTGTHCESVIGTCPAENTSDATGTYFWPLTERSAIVTLNCNYGAKEGVTGSKGAVRTCGQNQIWSSANTSRCQYESIVSQQLYNLSTILVNEITATAVATELIQLVRKLNPKNTSSIDVGLVADVCDNIVYSNVKGENATKAYEDVLEVINAMMKNNRSAIKESEIATNSSRRYIHNVEQIAEKYSITSNSFSQIIATENMDVYGLDEDVGNFKGIALFKLDNGYLYEPNQQQLTHNVDAASGIQLPSTLLANNVKDLSKERLAFIIYSTNVMFRDEKLEKETEILPAKDVIAASVHNVSVDKLSDPVQIVFHRFEVQGDYFPHCYFWNNQLNGRLGGWDKDGCETAKVTSSYVMCHCYHLTSFSILMSPCGDDEEDRCPCGTVADEALSIVSYVGCGIGLVSLLATIVCLAVAKCCKRGEPMKVSFKIHFNLCAALALTIITFFTIDINANSASCVASAVLLHYFLLASITWMFIEGLSVYRDIVVVLNQGGCGCGKETFFIPAMIAGWGVPLLIVAVLFACQKTDLSDVYGLVTVKWQETTEVDTKYCWIKNDFVLIGASLIPSVVVIFFNFFVTHRVIAALKKRQTVLRISKTNDVNRVKALCVFGCLFGLTWIFGAATVFDYDSILGGSRVQCLILKIFHYLFVICNSLQGLAIFFFHILLNRTIQLANHCLLREKLRIQLKNKRQAPLSLIDNATDTLQRNTLTTTMEKSLSLSMNQSTDGEDLLEGVEMEMYSPVTNAVS